MNESNDFYISTYNLYITVNQSMENIVGELHADLSFGQYVLLKYISSEEGCRISQKELVERSTLKGPSISQLLKSLAGKGYILHYLKDNDSRCKEIALTEKAVSQIKCIDRKIQEQAEKGTDISKVDRYIAVLSSARNDWKEKGVFA